MALFSRLLVVASLVAITACSASADTAPNASQIKAKLQKKMAGRDITAVNTTPMKGVYEVIVGGHQIIYTDAKADYVLVGDMVDLSNHQSLTEQRTNELLKTDFKLLPLDKAIKEVRGDGSRQLAVFSDPDCPYCHRLENDSLKGVTNVTIYTFLFPLNIHPDAMRKSQAIWCASGNDVAAWRNWMDNKKLPDPIKTDCTTPITENLALGEKMGITGTPALVFTTGQIVPGAIPKEQIEKLLTAAAAAK
ncbi:DsbC family protein [Andreprevotia chitinilytica]|uniref:DsbC family protein n=1 Tax=Andreprevotia chitinilytica TaxID=396808 RepID=UPI00055912CB|nr:DsbC family protein [Andreprevotia chitinilytica]